MTRAPVHIPSEQLEGVVVVGLDDHEALRTLIQSCPTHPFGFTPPIYILETDLSRARESISSLGIGTDPRFHGAFGPNAGRELIQHLRSQIHALSIPTRVVTCGVHDPHLVGWLTDELLSLRDEQSHRIADWRASIANRAASRDQAYWSSRFNEISAGSPARVLIITTRYSSYMQHASKDLGRSLQQLGHEVYVLEEANEHTMLTPQLTVEAQHRIDPDIVISTNYPRPLRDAYFPPGAVNVCWIQDAMAHLFDELPVPPSEYDFVAGYVYKNAPAIESYPASRRMPSPLPVSEHKFHPTPVSETARESSTCDIAYISHQSQPVEDLHREYLEFWPARHHPHLELVRVELERTMRRWGSEIVNLNQNTFSREFDRMRSQTDDPQLLLKLWHQYAQPMLERMLRHRTLEWAAEVATKHGLDFRIYGRGWDRHQTLSRYAYGELPHDEQLRASFQCAKVQLHASPLGVGHQRQYECAMSGGLMLSLRSWSEFLRENWLSVNDYVDSDAEPDAALVSDRSECFSLRNHPRLANLLSERDAYPTPPRGWDHTRYDHVFAPDPSRSAVQKGMHNRERPLQLLADPFMMTFSTHQELEERIVRACSDPDWRNELSKGTYQRVSKKMSMGTFAEKLMRFLCTELDCPAPAEQGVLS
ncbi:MAG: hypothetical protein JJ916_15160 [Phycisphaerales bacterium]|nr:hypothetical protein [Phycisphaerales bacterium]